MRGSVIIDGVDIGELGMFILKGGDYDFLSFPERREPSKNNWHEYDGIDVDLTAVYFKEKKVIVRFYISANTGDDLLFMLHQFYDLISRPGYRQLYSREFEQIFSLRYVSCTVLTHRGGLYKAGKKSTELSVEFVMDDPLQIFGDSTIDTPSLFGDLLQNEDSTFSNTEESFFIELNEVRARNRNFVKLNGHDLSTFGIVVNQCYNTALKLPAVKDPLTRRSAYQTGLQTYFGKGTTFDTGQVVIECTMISSSIYEFYHNYTALFNQCARVGSLSLETFVGVQDCYYVSMQNFQKLRPFRYGAWVRFSLVFALTDPGLVKYVIGTENEEAILTEESQLILI